MRNVPYYNKRPRGRGNTRRPIRGNSTIESNGPDIKIRGNPTQLVEKYLGLARDASATGDRVVAESLYQHAEHYQRQLNLSAQNAPAQNPSMDQSNGYGDKDSAEVKPFNGRRESRDESYSSEESDV